MLLVIIVELDDLLLSRVRRTYCEKKMVEKIKWSETTPHGDTMRGLVSYVFITVNSRDIQ